MDGSIDPGVVLKFDNSRIELQPGMSQLFAEGETGDQIIFTSLNDNRFGAGGTFDTNGNQSNYLSETGASSPYGNTGKWVAFLLVSIQRQASIISILDLLGVRRQLRVGLQISIRRGASR